MQNNNGVVFMQKELTNSVNGYPTVGDALKGFKQNDLPVRKSVTKENPAVVGITVDNGGSELRAVLNLGDPNKEADTLPMWLAPNKLYKINESSFRNNKDVEDVGAIINVVKAPQDYLLGMYGSGASVSMFSSHLLELDNLSYKTDTDAYYNQFIYAIAETLYSGYHGSSKVSQIRMANGDSVLVGIEGGKIPAADSKNEGYVLISLVTTIPLQEHSGRADKSALFKDTICGEYTVEFPMVTGGVNIIHFTLLPELTRVAPEGGICVTSLGKDIRQDDITLIVDLGAVSIDTAIFVGKHLIKFESTKSHAGNTLIAELMAQLRDNGYHVNEEMTKSALTTGEIIKNGSVIDVRSIVEEARKSFATDSIKPDLVRVIGRANIIPQQLTKLILVGRMMDDDGIFTPLPNLIVDMLDIDGVETCMPYKIGRLSNLMAADAVNTLLTQRVKASHDNG